MDSTWFRCRNGLIAMFIATVVSSFCCWYMASKYVAPDYYKTKATNGSVEYPFN